MEYITVANVAAAVAIGLPVWWVLLREKPENKLMKVLQLKNSKDKYPHLIDKTYTDSGITYVYWIPDGVSMEMLADPKNPKHQMLKQSLADNHRMEVLPLDGHKIAFRVIERELAGNYPYSPEPADKGNPLVFALGESLAGAVTLKMGDTVPHICIAGSAGSGKSVCMRAMIASLILHPRRVYIHLIDLKGGVEFLPFMRCSRVESYAKNPGEGVGILHALQDEMIRRNELFFKEEVNNIDNYNAKHPKDTLKRHILFVDEFAEYAKNKEAKDILKDIARRARSCGIHMVVATQRPDADVLDGQIRANMPAYVCFMVASTTNSTLVLGHGGAEKLPGHGRGILRAPGIKDVEFQGYYLSESECESLVSPTYVKKAKHDIETSGVL
jgi:DNA segregation ATPase FtsK/SpoIIIE, S-DNA-T family